MWIGIRFDLELLNFIEKINFFNQIINFVYIIKNYVNRIKLWSNWDIWTVVISINFENNIVL